MIRKISTLSTALLIVLLLIVTSAGAAFAESDTGDGAQALTDTPQLTSSANVIEKTHALTDDASVFTQEQADELIKQLKEAGESTGWQFIIHTSNDGVSSGNMDSHYDNYYNSHNFEKDAIMLVIDMGSNNRVMRMKGDVKGYFAHDDDRYERIISAMKPYLNKGDMYGASQAFISEAKKVHAMGKTNLFLMSLKKFGIFIGLAAIAVGLIIFFVVKSKYKNMGKQGTYDLAANSSVDLSEVEDTFVTTHTTVRTIQKDSSSSGGSSNHSDGSGSRTF